MRSQCFASGDHIAMSRSAKRRLELAGRTTGERASKSRVSEYTAILSVAMALLSISLGFVTHNKDAERQDRLLMQDQARQKAHLQYEVLKAQISEEISCLRHLKTLLNEVASAGSTFGVALKSNDKTMTKAAKAEFEKQLQGLRHFQDQNEDYVRGPYLVWKVVANGYALLRKANYEDFAFVDFCSGDIGESKAFIERRQSELQQQLVSQAA